MPGDFLSGLIGRAFEQVPVLERRRPSLFEPERGHTGRESAWNESAEEVTVPDRWRSDTRLPIPGEWKPQPVQTRATQPSPEEKRFRDGPAERQAEVDGPFQATKDARPTAAEPARNNFSTVEQIPVPVRVERLTERHLETRETVVEHRDLQIERTRPAELAKENTLWLPPRHEVIEIRGEAVKADRQERPQGETPRSLTEAPRKEAPLSPPAERTSLRARAVPAVPSPPLVPTIQVTIGRLELRSPQPAPSPRPVTQRARTPKLGLDDYLRRREGGVQ